MNKTNTMFAALACILAAHVDTGGLKQAFSVEPMSDKDITEFCGDAGRVSLAVHYETLMSDMVDLQFGHECLGMFEVIGGGEAVLGHILSVSNNDGTPARAWWSV